MYRAGLELNHYGVSAEIFTFRIRWRIMLAGWLGNEGRTRAGEKRRYSPLLSLDIYIYIYICMCVCVCVCMYLRNSPKRARGCGCIAGRDWDPARWFRGRDSVLTCFDKRAPLCGRHETQRRLLSTQRRRAGSLFGGR